MSGMPMLCGTGPEIFRNRQHRTARQSNRCRRRRYTGPPDSVSRVEDSSSRCAMRPAL
ncbi:MAG: hypothetical protein BMS9Abin32_543 [Gammaproteobacteria bacterium]|nr:MAG: hypothetical protein BMS9Abin32_543 [Gammaproteobacteria bacterium]